MLHIRDVFRDLCPQLFQRAEFLFRPEEAEEADADLFPVDIPREIQKEGLDADPVVPLLGSRKAYRALKAAGVKADLIEFPGVGHGSWNPAVTDPEFLPWMFSQKK